MKKILKFILTGIMLFVLITSGFACNKGSDKPDDDSSNQSGIDREDITLPTEIIMNVVDKELYTEYTEEDLPTVLKRVKKSIVGINIKASDSKRFGTGIVIANTSDKQNSYIATSHTLIEKAESIEVILYDDAGSDFIKVKMVGTDPQTDICVIMINVFVEPVTLFQDSERFWAGDDIFAVSNSLGEQKLFASTGIVSASNFEVDMGEGNKNNLFAIDARISGDSYGSGVFTKKGGFLIGMVCNNGKHKEIPFAVDSDTLTSVCTEIKKNGFVEGRYKFGITVANNRTAWGIPESVVVTTVLKDGCIYEDGTGLKIGDIIESVKIHNTDYKITDSESLYQRLYMTDFKIGDEIEFKIKRNGALNNVIITIAQYDYFKYLEH